MQNSFDALGTSLDGQCSEYSRAEKKRARAAEHQRKQDEALEAEDIPVPPFNIDIQDDSNTALARMKDGRVIVGLDFETIYQVFTPEFQRRMALEVKREIKKQLQKPPTATNKMNDTSTSTTSPRRRTNYTADELAALRLQEEEEERALALRLELEEQAAWEAEQRHQQADEYFAAMVASEMNSAWKEVILSSSRNASMWNVRAGGLDSGNKTSNNPTSSSTIRQEWPELPIPSICLDKENPAIPGYDITRHKVHYKPSRTIRVLHKAAAKDDEDTEAVSPRTLAAIAAVEEEVPLEELGYRRTHNATVEKDDILQVAGKLSAAEIAAAAYTTFEEQAAAYERWQRQYGAQNEATLRYAEELATREEKQAEEHQQHGNHHQELTQERMRAMMRGGERHILSSSGPSGTGPSNLIELPSSDNERLNYSRKSIRKLVLEMFERGWRPLVGRGGGHLMYERYLEDIGKRQQCTLACTPSDIRTIRIVQAKLHRLDREVAAWRREAAEAQQQQQQAPEPPTN